MELTGTSGRMILLKTRLQNNVAHCHLYTSILIEKPGFLHVHVSSGGAISASLHIVSSSCPGGTQIIFDGVCGPRSETPTHI